MVEALKFIEQQEKMLEEINKQYAVSCEFYMIDKSDEKASKSDEFFKFFIQFFDQVVKAMPKEEKKRPAGGANKADGNRKHQIGQKVVGMNNLVAEL